MAKLQMLSFEDDDIIAQRIKDPEGVWSTMIEEMGAGIC